MTTNQTVIKETSQAKIIKTDNGYDVIENDGWVRLFNAPLEIAMKELESYTQRIVWGK